MSVTSLHWLPFFSHCLLATACSCWLMFICCLLSAVCWIKTKQTKQKTAAVCCLLFTELKFAVCCPLNQNRPTKIKNTKTAAVCCLLPSAVRSGGDSHYFKSFLLYWILSPLPSLAFHFHIPSLLNVHSGMSFPYEVGMNQHMLDWRMHVRPLPDPSPVTIPLLSRCRMPFHSDCFGCC